MLKIIIGYIFCLIYQIKSTFKTTFSPGLTLINLYIYLKQLLQGCMQQWIVQLTKDFKHSAVAELRAADAGHWLTDCHLHLRHLLCVELSKKPIRLVISYWLVMKFNVLHVTEKLQSNMNCRQLQGLIFSMDAILTPSPISYVHHKPAKKCHLFTVYTNTKFKLIYHTN